MSKNSIPYYVSQARVHVYSSFSVSQHCETCDSFTNLYNHNYFCSSVFKYCMLTVKFIWASFHIYQFNSLENADNSA